MRILFAGDWCFDFYEKACAQALESLGVHVIPFKWDGYFQGIPGRAQSKFPFAGPAICRLNKDLLKLAEKSRPDAVFIWRGTHILRGTLSAIKKETGAALVSYNHDDPFAPEANRQVPWHYHFYWNLFVKSISEYDIHFVVRQVNIPEFFEKGAIQVHILKQFFCPELHHPLVLCEPDRSKYECDVVFAGHYEPDGRVQRLRRLVEAGLHVRLFGGKYWTSRVLGDLAGYFGEIRQVHGIDYAKALCGAKLCLCFMSKMNRDNYTTRCFEIPACGGLLLSERTGDLKLMFKEDEEAVFFSSVEELVEKALWLKSRPDEIARIAAAGMRRVHDDGHSVEDRMKQFLAVVEEHLVKHE